MGLKIVIFGASGMVGQGALREALADPDVEAVLSVCRRPGGQAHPKLSELVLAELFQVPADEPRLRGFDGALWAIGVSSVGVDEAEYRRQTRDLTLAWAQALLALNPGMSFCYCSAAGADGAGMWPRVRREIEGALQALPFKHVGCVRPAFIQPGPGIRSRTALYQFFISAFSWAFPLLVRWMPAFSTTSERLGRAMLRVLKGEAKAPILESSDINALGQ